MIVIYIITNMVNDKVYIGSTKNIDDRFYQHKHDLNNCIHHNEHLQNAWNKYGSESFEFKTLMVCPDSERNHCEQMMIDLYDAQNHDYGYNIKDAEGHSIAEETRQKMSESHTGKKRPKHSKRMKGENNPNYKKSRSDETKQKISESLTKNYARIIKYGFDKGKQVYMVKYNGKVLKQSIHLHKLYKWWGENYPNELLYLEI